MTDHPVLIPTSFGIVEGVVSEPSGFCEAGLVIVQAGDEGRWGTNGVWTRAARELARAGALVLRADYARGLPAETDSAKDPAGRLAAIWKRDVIAREEINDWFMQRVAGDDLLMAGFCRGARFAIHLAARNDAISRLLLMGPHLIEPVGRRRWLTRGLKGRGQPEMRIDPRAMTNLLSVIERVPVTMICTDREAAVLRQSVAHRALDLDVIVEPPLNRLQSPEVQAAVLDHTVRWGVRAVRSVAHEGVRGAGYLRG